MINPVQITGMLKTAAKTISTPEVAKTVTGAVKGSEQKVMQHLSGVGIRNSVTLDLASVQHKLQKELISSRAAELKPIETVEEYKSIMERIKNSSLGKNIKEDLATDYKDIDILEEGLLPYCGNRADIHGEINRYLSGRAGVENEPLMQDVIRTLDFSLKNLDKNFGKYDGFVFRQGVMKSGEGQFWSTAQNPAGAGNFGKAWNSPEEILDREYSVIRTKSGHRISDFQKTYKNKFIAEDEILLARDKDYRLIPEEEYTTEMLEAREKMLNNLFQHNNKMWKKLQKGQTVSFDKRVQNESTGKVTYETVDVDLDYLRKMIKVFEEV